jgi:hypothetical protein
VNDAAYIVGGWIVGCGAIAVYAVRVLVRGRSLSRLVPEHRRRWMTADTSGTSATGGTP